MTSSPVKRLSADAMLIGVAMMLSYLEAILPLSLIVPIPGAKLGLANVAVTLCFFKISPIDAAAVSLIRISLTALLFGNVQSLLFSLFGSVLAYIGMCIAKLFIKHLSFYGISVMCAALHNLGQCLAAMIVLGSPEILSYLPLLLICALFFGLITGAVITPISKIKVFTNNA
ncbi:MAG: Gx transporter family protein [Ruminococcaceae bacterium]|nr:Gx transporter family protein [Oscillospiraceae bacterium]